MRRLPYALALLSAVPLSTVLLSVPAAHATTCPLVSDPSGDARPLLGLLPSNDAADIVGIDVASGPTTVVVEMHVKSLLAPPVNPLSTLEDAYGVEWDLRWEIDGTTYVVSARTAFLNASFYTWHFRRNDVWTGPVSLAVDEAAGSLTWTIPRSYLPELATPGRTFTTFVGSGWVFDSSVDYAYDTTSTATYVDQDPGCIPAA